jgi:hypothetical protein
MSNKLANDVKRNGRGFFKYYPIISWETDENHENFSQDDRSPGQDFNLPPPENEVVVLTIRPRRSVHSVYV